MISIYKFEDFRIYIKERLKEFPNEGYGQPHKLAQFLNVHTTLISQVLGNKKSFSPEQGIKAAEFLGLNEYESDYFLTLIQLDRAGTEQLKRHLRNQLSMKRKSSVELVNRLAKEAEIDERRKAIYYSDWLYAAAFQLVAIKGYDTIESVADYFGISIPKTRRVFDFLIKTGLVIEKKGILKVGVRTIHLDAKSPWINSLHVQWRQKSIQQLSEEDPFKIHYSCPMTLSLSDVEKIRDMIIEFLEQTDKVLIPSPSEELRCLNIDWFKVR